MYTFAIALYAFAARLIAPLHAKAEKMIKGQKETFSILKKSIDPQARYIWFHAASLGEFEQGSPVVEKIRKEHPELKVLLTFFSPSGYEIKKNYKGADVVCYLPFDLPKNVNRFLQLANPSVAIFIKYEFWMNYLLALQKRQIPTYIISAIFRPSQLFFRPYGKLYRPVLQCYNWFFVQDDASRSLLSRYNIHNVSVSGDTRFDRVCTICQNRKELPLVEQFVNSNNSGGKQFTFVAGSTWAKDEDILIDYFNCHPEIKLIIAPHEIDKERQKSLINKLKRPHIYFSKANETNIQQADCLIVDCIGLLSSIYRYGEIAYIGGGFGAGIHNILEAAVYGIPVIFGPNYHKFREARELIAQGGGFSIETQSSFNQLLGNFTANPHQLEQAGHIAGKYVSGNTGATEIIYDKLRPKL